MRILILLLFSVQCFGQETYLASKPLLFHPIGQIEGVVGEITIPLHNDASYTAVPLPRSAFDTTEIKAKKDTMNVPLVSIKESMDYLKSINEKLMAMKTLNLIQDREYNELVKELNRIVAILDKKKKAFK